MPEVAVASPVVEVDAKLAGRAGTLRIVGIDVFRAGYMQPGLIPPAAERLDALRPRRAVPEPGGGALAGRGGGRRRCALQVALADVPLRVAGVLARGRRSQRFAVMDIAGAQAALRPPRGAVSRIDLRLAAGRRRGGIRRAAGGAAAGRARRRPPRDGDRGGAASLSRSYRVNLNVLALVALFTGGLLVFSTQALRSCAGARSSRCCACWA